MPKSTAGRIPCRKSSRLAHAHLLALLALVAGSLLSCWVVLAAFARPVPQNRAGNGPVTAQQVRAAIAKGQRYLKQEQGPDGSWAGTSAVATQGLSVLATLALLESGLGPDDPAVARALAFLRSFDPTRPSQWRTYITSLHTMALQAAGQLDRDLPLIQRNARVLEASQVPSGGRQMGAWGYGIGSTRWDNSNTQYAVLGLHAASQAGVQINPVVWLRIRNHFLGYQAADGSWGYQGSSRGTGSMTVAGIASLVIAGMELEQTQEKLVAGQIVGCGQIREPEPLRRAINWLGQNTGISIDGRGRVVRITNPRESSWTFYYLYGLERAGRLTGRRYFGVHDWYREGAEWLVKVQDPVTGAWRGGGLERPVIATSFALLFLSKGLAPVLINKLRYGVARGADAEDWNNDPHDIRRLTAHVARLWKHRLNWQIVDISRASVADLLQAPIVYFNGHNPPQFRPEEKKKLREFVLQGGFIFAEACCSSDRFDTGFRRLMRELFPESNLRPLPPEHPVWRAQYPLEPDGSLWGIDIGCRTSIIYSPHDLSCYWQNPSWAASQRPTKLGVNVVAYATGREIPPDKLSVRAPVKLDETDPAARDTLRIGKLRHGGDWNAAPLAIPNLMVHLREQYGFRVQLRHEPIGPLDPNLYRFPFLYMHGRNRFRYTEDEIRNLRSLLLRGATLFADACCGAEPFDEAFRLFARQLFPEHPLQPIPLDDPLVTGQYGGYDLSKVQYTRAMPQRTGPVALEGIMIDDRWVVVYSRWDIGCALERHQGSECRGYTHESALRIATNVLLYALLR